MNNITKSFMEQSANQQYSGPARSDMACAEASPGQHQKLIRRSDGTHVLVIRLAGGSIEWVPVLVFEQGVIA
jgi:hypothetical protein